MGESAKKRRDRPKVKQIDVVCKDLKKCGVTDLKVNTKDRARQKKIIKALDLK